ncbi:MAG: response regulator [Nitrospirae bacterium]|nr:MAG: response regulator [Nitrospirota bacterium]
MVEERRMATILLVDDEEIFLTLLEQMLSSHGHEVFTACNGPEALKLFRQHDPQISILDLHMPEMDGLEVLRQIHAIDPKASVMILTAWQTDELERQARQYGAIDFISKQLTYDSIVTVVEGLTKDPDKLFEPGSVLLITDSDETRDLFEPFLREHKVSLRVARDCPEALGRVSEALPQLIVLDMDLIAVEDPWRGTRKMAAPELLEALRQIRYSGRLILMSNIVDHAMDAQATPLQASTLQAVDHLQKPVTPDRLLIAIQLALPIDTTPQ